MEKNPQSTSLQHEKGNILYKWARALREEGDQLSSNMKFEEARKYFEDYKNARIAAGRLVEINFKPRQNLPQGYIWRQATKNVSPELRSFSVHGKIWTGRVGTLQYKGQYGRIEASNALGDTFNIDFTPRYFARRNLRMHEPVKFVVAILSIGLIAVSEEQRPFAFTADDVFVKE